MPEGPTGGYDIERLAPVYQLPRSTPRRDGLEQLDRPVPNSPDQARFPILHLDELELGDDPVWLIEGLLPATGLGAVFGLPKSLKSFLLSDALFHVAMGRSWAGREVLQGAVVYVTGEAQEGFKRRVIAMRRHYDVEGAGVPFLFVPVAPDLGHISGDEQVLIETIRHRLALIGNPPVRAVAIDTLARSMKGADENTAKDMSVFVDNCERIATSLGCLVVGVHHAGKDAAKGSRGSNALDGAVDVMWSVEKGEASSTAAIHHMKDGEAGASWQFWLQEVVLREEGAAGGFAAAAVVKMLSQPGEAKQRAAVRSKRLPDRPRLLLDVLRHAIGEMGEQVHGNPNVPPDSNSITRSDLKKYLPLRGYWDDEITPATNRANLSRDIKLLVARQIVGASGEWLWLRTP